jgi:flagellar export protein FliJ
LKRLRFRLERVLALRRMSERQALAQYAGERARAEHSEAAAATARAEAQDALAQLGAVNVAPGPRIVGERVVRVLDVRAKEHGRRAVEARAEADRSVVRWRARRVEAEAIERLKQRSRERHRTEFDRTEERERDEAVSARRATGTAAAEDLKRSRRGLR